jgi:hypothetical protein
MGKDHKPRCLWCEVAALILGLSISASATYLAWTIAEYGIHGIHKQILGALVGMVVVVSVVASVKEVLSLLSAAQRTVPNATQTLSRLYHLRLARKSGPIKWALLGTVGLLVIVSPMVRGVDLLSIAWVVGGGYLMMILLEITTQIRIDRGMFGTTRVEAREFLQFLLENANDIDFTDGRGNRRRTLEVEVTKSPAEPRSATLPTKGVP